MTRFHSIARKLRLIAGSDLVTVDKLRYMLSCLGRSLPVAVRCIQGKALDHKRQQYRLRDGPSIALRENTTDSRVFDEIFLDRAYASCVAALHDNRGPITLIDLGANIGLSALFLARALHVAEIVAVEPDPGNFELLSENLRRGGLANRSTAIRAFAGAERAFAELHDSGNGAWGMRMGAFSTSGTPVLTMTDIASATKSNAPLLLKCDIEGGEREILLHIRDWEHLIPCIFLELHTEFLSVQELHACLESSGFEWTIHGTPLPGASIAVLLLERGQARS